VQRRNREVKSFVEIKPVPVVKHVEILQFIFAKVVYEHALGAVAVGYTPHIVILLEIYSGVATTKIIEMS